MNEDSFFLRKKEEGRKENLRKRVPPEEGKGGALLGW